MEEDIKVLEDYAYAMCTISSTTEQDQRIAQAIKNLIAGYKELEEKADRLGKLYYEANENCIKYEKDYMPKSKVREKIEALDDIESEYSKKILNISKETATFTIFVQEILKQLLQEGDK